MTTPAIAMTQRFGTLAVDMDVSPLAGNGGGMLQILNIATNVCS
jgi:hypothetical protein